MQITESISISEAEWEVMRVVWANEYVTSREVIEILSEKMEWKESTIKTLLGRLVKKELLITKRDGRKFIYTTEINEEAVIKDYSIDILTRVCDKQESTVVKHLLSNAKLDQSDILDLIELLELRLPEAPEKISCECIPGQCDC